MTLDVAVTFAAGLVFAIGLAISGMADPDRVLGFLDLAGRWDPTLLFVMGSAVVVSSILFGFARRRPAPVLTARFELPSATRIDARLLIGAAVFGVGWGLAGYCPGPALVSLFGGGSRAFAFVGSMLVGLYAGNLVTARLDRRGGRRAEGAS